MAAAAPDAPRWFQLYVFRDEGVTRSIVDQAVAAGFRAIVLTIDAPYFGRRERDLRTGWLIPDEPAVPALEAALGAMRATSVSEHFKLISPSISWKDVERLSSETKLPVLVKGVHTAEDALLAVEHGAAGIIVSNHGGRQLDGVAASVDVLPEVVEAVGDRVEVLVDGGIRRGVDVMVALALGAQGRARRAAGALGPRGRRRGRRGARARPPARRAEARARAVRLLLTGRGDARARRSRGLSASCAASLGSTFAQSTTRKAIAPRMSTNTGASTSALSHERSKKYLPPTTSTAQARTDTAIARAFTGAA